MHRGHGCQAAAGRCRKCSRAVARAGTGACVSLQWEGVPAQAAWHGMLSGEGGGEGPPQATKAELAAATPAAISMATLTAVSNAPDATPAQGPQVSMQQSSLAARPEDIAQAHFVSSSIGDAWQTAQQCGLPACSWRCFRRQGRPNTPARKETNRVE